MILNRKNVPIQEQKLFLGPPLGLQRYDEFKYPVFFDLFDRQLTLFWRPEEISLQKDRVDYTTLEDHEKHIFTSNLLFQTLMDSVVGRGVNTFAKYITSPELEACFNVWQMFETLHSYSYTYIIKNLYPNPSHLLDQALLIPEIQARIDSVCNSYEELEKATEDNVKSKIYLALISVNILEAVRFYVSFICAFAFAENKKMVGNADIVKFIKRDECVLPDTQILTTSGWLEIQHLTMGTKIAQYTSAGEIEFVLPINLSKSNVNFIYNFSNKYKHVNVDVSENHRIITKHTRSRLLVETLAKDFEGKTYLDLPCAGIKKTGTKGSLTPEEQFLIAFQADGETNKDENRTGEKCGYRRVRLEFRKERKKERLRKILSSCGWEYYEKELTDNYTRFFVDIPPELELKILNWIDYANVNYNWCREFVDELSYWDGHRVDGETKRITYGSVIKENTDSVQIVCAMAGYRTHYKCMLDNRSENFSDYHRLQICRDRDYLSSQSLEKTKIPYQGLVYGVQVPSGMILIRNKNSVCVTGNSQHLFITQSILNILNKREEEGFLETVEQNRDIAIQMFRDAVEEEKAWAKYLFKDGSILGLNENILSNYIEWLADSRMSAIGLPKQYHVKHNGLGSWITPWMESSSVQVAPQESEIQSYKIGAGKNDIENLDLSEFEL